MKKFAAIVLALTLVMALCACGGTSNTTTPQSGNNTGNSSQTGKTTPTGYLFTGNGVQFGVDIIADEVLSQLGEPMKKSTSESCAFGGNDTNYTYNGFEISTNDEYGYERIYSIYLSNDLVSTEEGICVGSTADQVKTAYGEPGAKSTETNLVYEKDSMTLTFVLANNVVAAVRYDDI